MTSVAPAGVLGRGGAGLWLFVGLMLMLCTLLPRLHKRLKVSAKFCGSFRTFSMMKAPTTTTKNVFEGWVMLFLEVKLKSSWGQFS